MKVLVIGGTKFLGYYLTRTLLEEGFEVTLFNRGITPDDFGSSVKRVYGNRKDYKKFYETFRREKFDVVVDLIAYEPEDVEVIEKTFHDRVGQYIFISTGQVYLITENKHQPAREEDYYQKLIPCPKGEEAAYEYGLKKRQIEDYLEEAYRLRKFPSVRFRCPIIEGPRDYTLRLYSYLLRIDDGYPIVIPENGDNIIRHVYVKDVARALVSVLGVEKTRGKVYNLAQEEVVRLSEFLRLIARLMGKTIQLVKVPERELLEKEIPLDISPFSGHWVSYLDPTYAREEIGFRTTPLEKWLKPTIYYFMEEYQGEKPANYRYRSREIELAEKWKFEQGIPE